MQTNSDIYQMAYGKIITVSDDGIRTINDLMMATNDHAIVTSDLYCELIKLISIYHITNKSNVQPQSECKKPMGASSSFTNGLVLGSLL